MNLYTIVLIGLFIPCYLTGQVIEPNKIDLEIGIVEKLDSYIPLGITLISENGDTLSTGDLLGKPTILTLVYYRCPGICTPLMDGLADVVKKTDLEVGKDFQILTVSFNPREGTSLAKRKKKQLHECSGA